MKKSDLRVFTLMLLVVALTFIGCRVKNPCKVEMGETKNGTILLDQDLPEDKLVENGSELDFRVVPDEGYVVGSWTIEGGEFVEGGEAGSKTAKIKITDNFKISVSFVEVYSVSFNVHGENGNIVATYGENSIEPSTIENVPANTQITFTATPDTDYLVDSWTITGGELKSGGTDGATTALVKVTENVRVSVSFVIKKYNVTFSVDSENSNGSIKASYGENTYTTSPINVQVNTEVTFTATPKNDEYTVGSWTITGGSFTSGGGDGDETAVVVVNSNINIEVSFNFTFPEKTFTVGDISFIMKKIEGVKDTTLGATGQDNNYPHEVSLSEYWMGETEVTQELWQEVMGSNPSYFNNTGIQDFYGELLDTDPDGGEVQGKRPVEKVLWWDCIAFCNELTKRVYGEEECVYYDSGDNTVYTVEDATNSKDPLFDINSNKKGFRLPTEAEWEYAAKGGEDYTYSGSNTIGDVAWWGWDKSHIPEANANRKTHQVKKLAANGYGLYDMSGNVYEWCFDKINEENTQDPPEGMNPVGNIGTSRVIRGGHSFSGSAGCNLVKRELSCPGDTGETYGLRLACRF